MTASSLSFTILKRYWKYSLFILLAMSYFCYSTIQFVEFQYKIHNELSQLAPIDAEVIGAKGSMVDHLKRLLKNEIVGESPLIPKNLFDSLTTMSPHAMSGILYLGTYKNTSVITAQKNLEIFLKSNLNLLDDLTSQEVLVGLTTAKIYGLKENDEITIKSNFGSNVSEDITTPVKIKAIVDLGPWNSVILGSFKLSDLILEKLNFSKDQVWKSKVLSYILVQKSMNQNTTDLENLVNKKTVASYFKISEEINGFLKMTGLDLIKDQKIVWMTLLTSLTTLFSFLIIWFPILREVKKVIHRLKYSSAYIFKVYFYVYSFLTLAGILLGFAINSFCPLL